MKKIFLLAILFPFNIKIFAQAPTIPDWYKNLEKYWFYRYRLVNDFMLISDEAGGTIPAQKRIRYCDPNYPNCPNDKHKIPNTLSWEQDASTDLGYYIAALASEYTQLNSYGWSTSRTEWELEHAISAIERLDELAEIYCYNVNGNYSGAYPGTLSPSQLTQYPNSNNGFFIRDDVPFYDFVEKHLSHFNRPGINDPITKVNSAMESSFYERYTGTNPNPNKTNVSKDPTFASGTPVYPVEESQDQLIAIFYGLALAKDCGVNSFNLQNRIDDKLYKIVKYPFTDPNLRFRIKNPLTNDCVYGVSPDAYPKSCNEGGAEFIINSRPASAGVNQLVNSTQSASLENDGLANDLIYQAIQLKNEDPFKDFKGNWQKAQFISFTDCLSAVSRKWVNFWLPWPVNRFANTTWKRVRDHSMSDFFGTPDLPLLYKWFHPNNGVDFCPECHSTPQNLYGWQLPSYTYLLNSAPACGPYNHNYTADYADREWSSNNRLADPFHRRGVGVFGFTDNFDGSGELYDNADYNGIDYMVLFNLYSHVSSGYLNLMINPYYTENFNTNYPDINSLGSNTKKLTLNYLEYLSAKNKINNNGNLTLRGGKVIELNPGFEATYGANFVAYINDYSCSDGPFNYAQETDIIPNQDVQPQPYPIVYSPQPGIRSLVPPEESYSEDDSVDYYVNPYTDSLLLDSFKTYALNSGDSDLINIYYNLFGDSILISGLKMPNNRSTNSISGYQSPKLGFYNIADTDRIRIYPNPNDGNFIIQIPNDGIFEVKLVNILGVTVYETQMDNEHKKSLSLTDSAPPGTYTVHITGNDVNFVQKLVITK